MTIVLKRAYGPAEKEDGYRVLVERLWPRGLSKERTRVDRRARDAGASTELRTWFGHDPGKREEFRRRYVDEIRGRPDAREELRGVLGAHATGHNSAVALTEYLEAEA